MSNLNANLSSITDPFDITNKKHQSKVSPTVSIDAYLPAYKDKTVEVNYDSATFSGIVVPDNSLIFVGPPRANATDGNNLLSYALLGQVTNFNYSESQQIMPIKALGSQRHMFASSNMPIQISMSRILIASSNFYKVLYQTVDKDVLFQNNDPSLANGGQLETGTDYASYALKKDDAWYANISSDLAKIPVGIGIICNTAKGLIDKVSAGGYYFESCYITSESGSIQPGSGFALENVSIIGDRKVPWNISGLATTTQNI